MTRGRAVGFDRGRGLLALAPLAVLFLFQAADAQTRFMYLSGQSVHPAYEGWWPNEDGSYELWFGYMNSNWEEEPDVPVGPDNYFAFTEPGGLDDLERDAYDASMADQGQPTHFYPRRNPFLFTITVPADFSERELVWTFTSNGVTNRAYATLKGDYRVDPQVMSLEMGGMFGSQDDRIRTNVPPDINLEGDMYRRAKVGEPLTLVAVVHDPNNFPSTSDVAVRPGRGALPETLEQLYSSSWVGCAGGCPQGPPGLRFSWTVYRGPGKHVTFAPDQLEAWMDTRVWAHSPWGAPHILPEIPPDNRWVTDVIFEEPGEYMLRGVAGDGSYPSYADVTVTVTR